MDWSNPADFVPFLLEMFYPLLIFLVIALGVMLALSRAKPSWKKRAAQWLGAIVIVAVSGLYILLIDTWLMHLDTPDLFSPLPEKKLEEWTRVCETSFSAGTSLEDAETYIQGLGMYTSDNENYEPWTGQPYYRHFRKGNWVQYKLLDTRVRNRSAVGDIDIETTVELHDDVVTSCHAIIFKHGR